MAIPILRAKLSPPELRQDHLARPALIQKLDNVLKKKLSVLVASAGYGKSSLLAEWVQTLPGERRVVWYSLEAGDQDPVVFFSYLIAGLRAHWPDFGRGLEAALNRPVPLNPEQMMVSLLSELEKALQEGSLVLILDDYYTLRDPAQIDSMLSQMLHHLPGNMHLVVASRQPVSFSIARLRAQGQTLEISEDELRFTPEAARKLFGAEGLPASVQELIQQAEGWITGLQLIRQVYLQAQPGELDQIMTRAPDWMRGIFDYLAEEVFERLPAALQDFLMQSSILETLAPADCDAIFERSDSGEWLETLVSQGLYTMLLSRNPDTYRYHHLLRDFLRQRSQRNSDAAQVSAWHARAAEHYQAAQRWSDAFHHAILVNEDLAVEVFVKACSTLRMYGQNSTLQIYLDQFSENAYRSHPFLYAWQGLIWEDQSQHIKAQAIIQHAIACAEPLQDSRSLYIGWVGLGWINQRLGDLTKSLEAYEKAIVYAEQRGANEQLSALNGMAITLEFSGKNLQSLKIYQRCLELSVNLSKPLQALVIQNIGTAQIFMGNLGEAKQCLEEAIKLREEINQRAGLASPMNNLGIVLTMMGDLDSAEQNIRSACDNFKEFHNDSWYSYALSNLGELAVARGDFKQAEEYYQQSLSIKEQLDDPRGLQHTWALMSDLRRQQGDIQAAESYAQKTLKTWTGSTGFNEHILAQTALALAWLSEKKGIEAIELLTNIIVQHRELTHNHYQLTRCLWYLAQAQFQLEQDGRPALEEALALAERWEYHFLISRLARELPHLVGMAVAEELQPVFVGKVLSRLGDAAVPELSRLLHSPVPSVRRRAIEQMAELGTDGAWKPLAQTAEHDTEAEIKAQAKAALARLEASTPPTLRVTTLGRFTLRVGEREVNPTEWGNNRKAQSLFKILLSQPRKHVSREKIIDQLWPGTSFETMENANHTLNQAMSALRKVLEPYLPAHYPSRYIFSDNETYCLTLPPGSWTDDRALEEAIRLAKAARRQGKQDEMIRQYQVASELYGGDYLVEESKLDWPLARQDWLREQIVGVLEALARLGLEQNDAQGAAELAERLLGIDALHEAGYLLLMRAQVALGQLKAALNTYQRYLEKCCQVLDISPNAEIREVYEGVLREMRKR